MNDATIQLDMLDR